MSNAVGSHMNEGEAIGDRLAHLNRTLHVDRYRGSQAMLMDRSRLIHPPRLNAAAIGTLVRSVAERDPSPKDRLAA